MNTAPVHLTYNGKSYPLTDLIARLEDEVPVGLSQEERKDLVDFLNAWLDQKPYIEVSTSGSTGRPKPIRLSKSEMVNSARLTIGYFDLDRPLNALLCLPVKFIAGKMMVIRALVGGWNLWHAQPSLAPLQTVDTNINFTAMTPMQVHTILGETPGKLNLVDQVIIGGGAVTPALRNALQPLKTRAYATFGMTETITHIAVQPLNGSASSRYFHALQGVHFERDERSCLVIHAGHLAASPVITNDMVQLKNKDAFQWLGRIDHVINSGGIKVNPEMVEEKLSNLMAQNFVVTGVPDPVLGEKVVLAVEGGQKDEHSLTRHFAKILDKYETPKNIYFFQHFPLTPTGKTDRKSISKLIESKGEIR